MKIFNRFSRERGTPDCFVFRRSGLGDDLMVFWAGVALVKLNRLPASVSIFFQRESIRTFLQTLGSQFPEVDVPDTPPANVPTVKVRLYGKDPHTPPIREILRMWWGGMERYACPYHHKFLHEYGKEWRMPWSLRIGKHLGVIHAWNKPYPAWYDGLQEWGIALDDNRREVKRIHDRMPSIWQTIRERCRWGRGSEQTDEIGPLLFPGAGSFQDFEQEFIQLIKQARPDLKIARYEGDRRPADIHYGGLDELCNLICRSTYVVTNDSLPSHIAQFFARRHVLIASWARPSTVCFPGAQNTSIVDLGTQLPCRPCAYYPLEVDRCPAGYHRCHAQIEPGQRNQRRLREVLQKQAHEKEVP